MMQTANDRVLLIDKPAGITSFDVISSLKRRLKIKKAGHSGTLDRLASGLLIVATGRATKLTRYFLDQPKEYTAAVSLGIETDTCDRDGEITRRSDVTAGHYDRLDSVIGAFTGTIEQTPPVYSAVKIQGLRASDRVRRGEHVEMTPRQVTVYSIQVLEVHTDSNRAKLKVSCSKGTYIRSLARDIGRVLGCGASVHDLRRTASGPFRIEDAASPDETVLGPPSKRGCLRMEDSVPFMNRIILASGAETKVLHGMRFGQNEVDSFESQDSEFTAVFSMKNDLVAVARINYDEWNVRYLNVFN